MIQILTLLNQVLTNSKAEKLGIRTGDIIAATSATAGDQMWAHDSAESVRSALSTRFVMSATVKMRLERSLQSIPEEIISDLRIPYYTVVKLKRPIGLHVTEGPGKTVFVQGIKPNLGAARSRRVEIGDQIIAMSASWGDRMWDVNSVDSFVVGVKMRRDPQLSFKLKRMVPFDVFTGQVADKKQKDLREPQLQGKSTAISQQLAKISITDTSSEKGSSHSLTPCVQINRMLDSARSSNDLAEIVNFLLKNQHVRLTAYLINKIMTMCLRKELPDLAIKLFENSFNFHLSDPNPALSALHLFDDDIEDSEIAWSQISAKSHKFDSLIDLEGQVVADDVVLRDDDDDDDDEVYDNDDEEIEASVTLDTNRGFVAESRRSPSRLSSSDDAYRPNNFVCTTAVKAYGRKMQVEKALALLPWMEMQGEKADVYFMSSLLYVCAKCKRVDDAERLFWKDIPRRKLSYTVATTNSLMYMYAKLNRPDDALRVYELTKDIGLKCTVVTYGVLIKALMRSGKPSFHQKAFEVVKTLPNIGIQPGIEVYNQILEYYSSTQNYRKTKAVLRMMAQVKPRVKPDAVTYGYLIACFADSKKPRSALTAFHQMMKKGIPPSSYTYMGVLKALAHMRDGLSAVQVIQEMIDVGISPDEKHFSMAMFACVIANQGSLAESIISLYIKRGGRPDTALCTLWLRALLQQGKWTAGLDLLHRMTKGKEFAKPNIQTYNYLLQYQVCNDLFNGSILLSFDYRFLLENWTTLQTLLILF